MMRIQCMQVIKIIFVLSTIVAVTDCCSSRILLLREHTLKIVQHQHNFHNHLHEHAHQLQQQIEEHVVQLVNQMELQQKLDEQLQEEDTNLEPDPDQESDPETEQIEPLELEIETDPSRGPPLTLEMAASSTWEPGLDLITDENPSTTTEKTTTTSTSSRTQTSTKPTITVTPSDEPPPSTPVTTTSPTGQSTNEPVRDTVTVSTDLPRGKDQVSVDFNMLPCVEDYNTSYCLNGGRCFRLPVSNHTLNYCECPDDYYGTRCDFKNWNGDYISTPVALEHQPKILMAHIVFSFPMLILLSTIYVLFAAVFMFRNAPEHRRKQQQLHLHKHRFFVSC
ncbi:protein gurken [Drosophila tropicalis]|uniref:protein gurken n=1 Tax=Drosophila tropicalis TaxID=46794 RepID=UPI0035AC0DC9